MSVRKNITMSDEVAKWYELKAQEMGLSQSAVMSIALTEYLKQNNALQTMADLLVEMKRMNEKKTK